MDELGILRYSFVNAQQERGRFSPTDEDLRFLVDIFETTAYDVVLSLGNDSSRTLRRIGVEHFALPHPSGLNRRLNDLDFVRAILNRCKEYIDVR